MRARIVIGGALVAVGAQLAIASAAQAGSISGTVTAQIPAGPLAGICVDAFDDGGPEPGTPIAQTTTAANGTYTLAGVPAGGHKVKAYSCDGVSTGYIPQWYRAGGGAST